MRDLVVAGGGPVGLAAAIRSRLCGLDVIVVEPRGTPIDKACGEGLMPSARSALDDLGVHVVGWPFAGIRYVDGARQAEARFRSGPGLGVRRTVLQAALADRCADLGVPVARGRVSGVRQDGDRVVAGDLEARWLVAADGLHSSVRREIGLLQQASAGAARYGLRRHFGLPPWSDLVEVHWSAEAEAYVTPLGPQLVGVAVLCGAAAHRRGFAATLAGFPALAARLEGAEGVTAVRGAGPLRQRATVPSRGRVLLAGDAAGYVDALTGEGLAVGLASAAAAVDAVVADDASSYDARWRAGTRRYRWITGALLAAAGRPDVRRAIVPAAHRAPWLFDRAVNALA